MRKFDVTYLDLDGIEQKCVAAARNAKDAEAWLANVKGWTILNVGPHLAKWKLKRDEFDDLTQIYLKLKWPISVRRTSRKGCDGRHSFSATKRSRTPVHRITVEKRLSPAQANVVLWHELAHAAQAERTAATLPLGLTAIQMVRAISASDYRSRKTPYHKRPCELEAKIYEQAADYWKLTKEV